MKFTNFSIMGIKRSNSRTLRDNAIAKLSKVIKRYHAQLKMHMNCISTAHIK